MSSHTTADSLAAFKALCGLAPAAAKPVADTDIDPYIDPAELRAANERHDQEHGNPWLWNRTRIKSSRARGGGWRR